MYDKQTYIQAHPAGDVSSMITLESLLTLQTGTEFHPLFLAELC